MSEIDPFIGFEQQFASGRMDQDQVHLRAELLAHGSLREWVDEVTARGESVEAKWLSPRTKDGREHNVYYLYRYGIDPETGDPFHIKHVACGCIYESLIEDDPALQAMFECQTLATGVIERAEEVKKELGLAEAWEHYVKIEDTLTDTSIDPVEAAMLDLLVREKKSSNYWLANLMGGQHELVLMSIILGRPVDELTEHAQLLESMRLVEVKDDRTVRLAA